jgi:EmrB/QacA subfamily drug resistance transporter
VDAYTLVFASLLITTGSMGDRFGRKRFLMLGLALFSLGSLGAALSTSTAMLTGFRALLGLAGAVVMPSTLSIIIDVFPDYRERARAIAIWSSIFSIGAGIGPIIGGALIASFHWASVFYLNLPIIGVGLLGGYLLAPESRDLNAPRPDVPGVLLSSIGLVSLVYGMIRAGEMGWLAAEVLSAFAVAVALLGAFLWWENRSATPMLPLEFFKNRSFSGANISLTISAFAMMGSMYFVSQYFQSVQGLSPLVASLCMLPMTPMSFLSTMLSVRVDRKLGTSRTVALGLALSGTGLLLFAALAGVDTPYWVLFCALVVLSSGFGFTMSPATNAVMSSLPPNRAGIGSAMNDTTRQLGGALGIAVLGALMNTTYRAQVGALAGLEGVSDDILEMIRGSVQTAHAVAATLSTNLADRVYQTASWAFVSGMKEAMIVGGITMFIAAGAALVFLPASIHRHQGQPEVKEATSEQAV